MHGNTIVLDELLPPFDGKRVVVVVELTEEMQVDLDPQRNLQAWKAWATSDRQGPIDDIAQLPDERLPAVREALIHILGLG